MSGNIPKNQVRTRNSIEQHEHEDNADARRVVLVDNLGDFVEVIEDSDGKKRLAVDARITISDPTIVVELSPDDDAVAISSHPNPIFAENADTITTSGFEEIFSYTSGDDAERIMKVECHVSTPALFQLKLNGVVKRELWSSSIDRNVKFKFDEHLPLLDGVELTIEAKVERFIHATYETFVSLEGYLRE